MGERSAAQRPPGFGAAGGAILATAAGAFGLFALPQLMGDYWAYQLSLFFLYAIAALGVGLCWGRAGFLPLGQALFFGLAAYLSGLALIAFEASYWLLLLLPLAALAPGLLAFGIGRLVFRRGRESGPYFSMITLALSLLGFQIANSYESVTGGFNGLKGIPGLPGLDGYVESYYVASAALILASLALAWLYRSPLGVLWAALSRNERRVSMFGFDTNRLKAVAFGVSGVFAGVAGALYAPQQGLVTPQAVAFLLSADLVIWTAVGGRSRLLGPALGAILLGVLTSELRTRFVWWEVVLALLFIGVVLLFPDGIGGALARLSAAIRRRVWPGRRTHGAEVAAPERALRVDAPPQLTIDAVDVRVGEVKILDRLSLRFEQPAIYCVIGPNGAGKTSTFNLLTGELPAQSGTARFDGHSIIGLPPHRIMRLGIGRKFQIPSVFVELTIADNLAIALWCGRTTRGDLLRPSLRRWTTPMRRALAERYPFLADADRTAAELSHGERQILELAMALLGEPRLLLLDEPCAGLSPSETDAVIDVVRWAAAQTHAMVVVIEHDMSLVRQLADRVFVLHNGTLLAEGSVAEVQADESVKAVYVGAEK
jgi:branched-chain amino acid transport system permease protein